MRRISASSHHVIVLVRPKNSFHLRRRRYQRGRKETNSVFAHRPAYVEMNAPVEENVARTRSLDSVKKKLGQGSSIAMEK